VSAVRGETLRELARRVFQIALDELDVGAKVARFLPPRPPKTGRVSMVAVGKAAPVMARAALRAWEDRISRALVVVPDGTPVLGLEANVLFAGHPLPDARSVEAAERALVLAAGAERDLLLVLISGGASALLAAPTEGSSLDRQIDLTRALLSSGAPIRYVNMVRRHVSRIKGGGLTRAAYPGRVLAVVTSDIVIGGIHDVGSGPTVPDPTTVEDAQRAVAQWVPAVETPPMVETLKTGEPAARRQRAWVVAGPHDLASALGAGFEREGFDSRSLPPSSEGADEMAAEYLRLSKEIPPRAAWVRAAEPSLAVRSSSPGRGGRSTHLAALVGRALPAGIVFLAGASDGVDGTSGTGGAVVDSTFRALGAHRIDRALSGFDSAALHAEAGTSIPSAPTGKNLADVHVLLRE
jgi:glycerate 2-kinase